MGPLVNRRAVDDMMDGIRRIREQGGEILYGGEAHRWAASCSRRWCARMPDMPILKEEIFAPILYLVEFDDLDEAIHWHNDVPQGLSSAMFTDQPDFGGDVPEPSRQRLRHRQRQHRHQRRGDRRRVRRREGDRRRTRIGQRRVEGLHAAADQHDQLVDATAAGAGDQVRKL